MRAERGAGATVLAGGTFLGILMNQGFLAPQALLTLGRVGELDYIEVSESGELRIGAITSHRKVERSTIVRGGLARTGARLLARGEPAGAQPGDGRRSARRRRLRLRSAGGAGRARARAPCCARSRASATVSVAELILGFYETCIEPDELLVEVRVPPAPGARRLPQVPLALARGPALRRGCRCGGEERLRVVVGAVARDAAGVSRRVRPRTRSRRDEIGRRYAERIEPISDSRGSAAYRRRVIAVEVRRALEALA